MNGNRRYAGMIRNKKSGSTMIETLVAFLVVVLMIGMFSKVVTASVHMLNSTRDVIEKTEKFNENYYKNLNNMKTESMTPYLTIDEEMTNVLNGAEKVKIQLNKDSGLKYNINDWGTGMVMYTFIVPKSVSE